MLWSVGEHLPYVQHTYMCVAAGSIFLLYFVNLITGKPQVEYKNVLLTGSFCIINVIQRRLYHYNVKKPN